MIALLTGKVVSKTPNEVVLDVSGVGYHILSTIPTFERLPDIGNEITLHIFTYVREDTLALYGFINRNEKELFIKLLKVNGIGPKLALAILSGVPPVDFVRAVENEDLARLNAIPGVGKKTAERIILDLKDKLMHFGITGPHDPSSKKSVSVLDDALSVLTNLGYNKTLAERVLGKIGVRKDATLSFIIKEALKEIGNR